MKQILGTLIEDIHATLIDNGFLMKYDVSISDGFFFLIYYESNLIPLLNLKKNVSEKYCDESWHIGL